VSGSCICAADVTQIGASPPAQSQWFFARSETIEKASRAPLIACGDAPLKERQEPVPLHCPWSGTEFLLIYGTPARSASIATLVSNTLIRVRTAQQFGVPGELQSAPFDFPPGSTLVGVFRDDPFAAPAGNGAHPLFAVWRVLLPE
jgi:hypothetical protein